MHGALFTSRTDEWYTPMYLIRQLEGEFGRFDLDPCCTPETAKAPSYFTKDDDGLERSWGGVCS